MELITINRKVRRKTKPVARCGTGHQGKAQECTTTAVADGFLRYRFSPIINGMSEQLKNKEAVERDFFNSLSNLQKLYGFEVQANEGLCYPCNIAEAWKETLYHMGRIAPDTDILIVDNSGEGTTIATYKGFNTGQHLYYIPMQPLWQLLDEKANKPLTDLLLSLFAYLYRIVGIPTYTHDDYHLYYTYSCVAEWYREAEELEEESLKELIAAYRLAKRGGTAIITKILRPIHLRSFGKRLAAFQPQNKNEGAIKALAQSFYELSFKYPLKSIGTSLYIDVLEPEVEERGYPDQYLSFIWDYDDILIDDVIEHINNELNEIGILEEPLAFQFFDRPEDKPLHDLSFEAALFPMIKELIALLINI